MKTAPDFKIKLFDENADKYDIWYEKNAYAYGSELKLLEPLIKEPECSVEIGLGTGRFAEMLKIKYGLEPSAGMAKIAKKRGIIVEQGVAEDMPYKDDSFVCALLMVTLCFVNNAKKTIKETYRILKPGGRIIIGIVDKDSVWGKDYIVKNSESIFYKSANFFSAQEIIDLVCEIGFNNIRSMQNIFGNPFKMESVHVPKYGHGQGLFTAIYAEKHT